MIGDEGTVHPTDFKLEGILDEPTPDEIVVLALERLKLTLLLVNGIVHILLIPLHIISNRRTRSRLYLKHKRSPRLVIVMTVNL